MFGAKQSTNAQVHPCVRKYSSIACIRRVPNPDLLCSEVTISARMDPLFDGYDSSESISSCSEIMPTIHPAMRSSSSATKIFPEHFSTRLSVQSMYASPLNAGRSRVRLSVSRSETYFCSSLMHDLMLSLSDGRYSRMTASIPQ